MSLDAAIAALPELLALVRQLEERTARIEAAVTTTAPEALAPLAEIIGCSADAARRRIGRDSQLRALGVKVGRRTLFDRALVLSYFRAGDGDGEGGRPRRLRSIEGGRR